MSARHLLGLSGAAVVLLIGLFLPDPFARWLCVFLGLIGLLMGAAKFALSPRSLALDDDGLTVETPFRATRIRWRHVKALKLQRVQQNKLIVVRCTGRWQGWRPFNANKARWVEQDYFVPNLFDAPLEEILLLCEQRLERAGDDQPDVQALRP
ncbi:MAG: hypothetical protein LPJ91_04840 [Pseudazoarcus pumilus]|nr:hypothetical protein [Pseudazoarcus pumilus]